MAIGPFLTPIRPVEPGFQHGLDFAGASRLGLTLGAIAHMETRKADPRNGPRIFNAQNARTCGKILGRDTGSDLVWIIGGIDWLTTRRS
jgi:hypothetical protein